MTQDVEAAVQARMAVTMALHDDGVQMMRLNLRRRHPDATDEEIDMRLGAYLQTRPGVEFGDCDGRLVPALR